METNAFEKDLCAFITCFFFQIICQACSSNKHGLDYMKNHPARVCDHCFKELQKQGKIKRLPVFHFCSYIYFRYFSGIRIFRITIVIFHLKWYFKS